MRSVPPIRLHKELDTRWQTNRFRVIPLLEHQGYNDEIITATVEDDSLSGDSIAEGEFVVVKTNFDQSELLPGRLVLIRTPSGLLVRHLYRTLDKRVRLVSSNELFPDIVYACEAVTIEGIIVFRQCDL